MIKKSVFAGVAALALLSGSPMAVAQSSIEFITKQTAEERLASNLLGVTVENAEGENIGDVNDLVLGPNGQVSAVIVGVGGFLGLGEKNVAVSYDNIESKVEDNDVVVVLNTTKADLEAAPEYVDANDQPYRIGETADGTDGVDGADGTTVDGPTGTVPDNAVETPAAPKN